MDTEEAECPQDLVALVIEGLHWEWSKRQLQITASANFPFLPQGNPHHTPAQTIVNNRHHRLCSTFFISQPTKEALIQSGHTIPFWAIGKAHHTAHEGGGCTLPNDPTNQWPFPKLLQRTCRPFTAHQCATCSIVVDKLLALVKHESEVFFFPQLHLLVFLNKL